MHSVRPGNNSSFNARSAAQAKTKITEVHTRTAKNKKPGESTRPMPKDREQIQDCIKELREMIYS